MAFYIWLDENGNETKRDTKGKGPPRKGSERREDGNYYITYTPPTEAPVTQPAAPESIPAESNDSEAIEQPNNGANGNGKHYTEGRSGKVINNSEAVDVEVFLKAIFRSARDESREKGEIDIRRVVVQSETGVSGIVMGGSFSRMVIRADGEVHIWSNPHGDATYIVKNAVKAVKHENPG